MAKSLKCGQTNRTTWLHVSDNRNKTETLNRVDKYHVRNTILMYQAGKTCYTALVSNQHITSRFLFSGRGVWGGGECRVEELALPTRAIQLSGKALSTR